ncbi:hypothetical protein SmJEL517_g04462 [Synchytrium microbalum]|uniref:Calponin-homology (CH) domain-containing protein n=1 Tax=Synchytrium microbalum TaxID=1806994 RepID=A0A507C4G4_9FUNG|nr:uncharacterized protein SmJEL517_g04462 [Synchytrium microbalum]TPX32423.1 hypothetical protein SmJEL517_g04462 [Synchytrium microbalum]
MQALTEEELQNLYAWIDTIPLSRPKRNLTRDFSDGVAAAEVVHHFFPKLVELHNYSPANALTQKLYNWNTLNQKVLRKLGYLASDDAIQGIINNKPGYAEWILNELRSKIELYAAQQTRTKGDPNMGMMMGMPGMVANAGGGYMNPMMGGGPGGPMSPHFVYAYPPALPMQQQIPQQQPQQMQARPAMSNYGYPPQQQQHVSPVAHHAPPPMPLAHPPAYGNARGHPAAPVKSDAVVIGELQDTIQILQLKVQKMEQLLTLKDKRIDDLTNRLRSHGIPS